MRQSRSYRRRVLPTVRLRLSITLCRHSSIAHETQVGRPNNKLWPTCVGEQHAQAEESKTLSDYDEFERPIAAHKDIGGERAVQWRQVAEVDSLDDRPAETEIHSD